MYPFAKILMSSYSLTPALQTTGTGPKGPDPGGASDVAIFPELWLPPGVSRGRGRLEPQRRGQARGASLVLMVISPLIYWEQRECPLSLFHGQPAQHGTKRAGWREEGTGRVRRNDPWGCNLCPFAPMGMTLKLLMCFLKFSWGL